MQHHRVEEHRRGYPKKLSKSSDQVEKCSLPARVGFLQNSGDTLIQHRKVSRNISKEGGRHFLGTVRYFSQRRAIL